MKKTKLVALACTLAVPMALFLAGCGAQPAQSTDANANKESTQQTQTTAYPPIEEDEETDRAAEEAFSMSPEDLALGDTSEEDEDFDDDLEADFETDPLEDFTPDDLSDLSLDDDDL